MAPSGPSFAAIVVPAKSFAFSFGVGGGTLATVAGTEQPKADARVPLSSPISVIEVYHIGTNDLNGFTTTGQVDSRLASLASNFDTRRAAGRKVGMFILADRTDASKSVNFDTFRARANAELVKWTTAGGGGSIVSGVHADAIPDWASNAAICAAGPSDNTTNFADKLHPTAVGYQIGETYLRPLANTL